MTRTDLEKYHDIVVRLHELKTVSITDTVVGSSVDYPYTSHPVTLHGIRGGDKTAAEVRQLEQKKANIDNYIDGITDVRAKTLLDMHYRKHKRWATVASNTGYSTDANEKYLQRFFQCP